MEWHGSRNISATTYITGGKALDNRALLNTHFKISICGVHIRWKERAGLDFAPCCYPLNGVVKGTAVGKE